MALTREQFDELYNRGLSVEQIVAFESGKKPQDFATPSEDKGFLRTAIEDPIKTLVVKPAVRFGQAIAGLGIEAFGSEKTKQAFSKAVQRDVDVPFFGLGSIKVEGQKPFGQGGGRQIVGDIAKTASYLYTGGAGSAAISTGLKGQVVAGLGQGLKTGVVGGGAYSFGESVQNAENSPANVAYDTLFGSVVGGTVGATLGAGLPIAIRAVGRVKELTNFASVEKELIEQNREILKPTPTQLSEWGQMKVNPIQTFTNEFGPEAIPTKGNILQLDDFIGQVEARYRAGAEGFNTILRNSPETVSLNEMEKNALEKINRSVLKPSMKEQGRAKIAQEFESIRSEASASGRLINEDRVPIAYADHLKDGFWSATKNFGTEESTVANTINKNIGFAFKEGIETAVEDINVRNFNKRLQELILLKDFLESRNGRVPGSGGRMARYMARIIGGTAGSGGGPIGTAMGAITADRIAQAMIDPASRTWLLRLQFQRLSPAERTSLQQEAEQIILDMAQKRAEMFQLPIGAMPMGGKSETTLLREQAIRKAENDLAQAQLRLKNILQLPAPESRTITPNTQGTPNYRVYQGPNQGGDVGGLRQRRT